MGRNSQTHLRDAAVFDRTRHEFQFTQQNAVPTTGLPRSLKDEPIDEIYPRFTSSLQHGRTG